MTTIPQPEPMMHEPNAAAAPPILDVHDVTVAYHRRPVLWDVDLTIHEPSLIGIVGPNGAGKSTLIKAILGLVPLASGSVAAFGQPIDRQRRRIGYVPQRESVDWDFPVSVLDVVLMGTYGQLGWFRRPGRRQRAWALECLEHVGLADLARQQIGQLSGGQQQRTFLARALAQRADLYFMDEPMAGVDAATEQVIFSLLRELREQGKTVFVVHHDLRTVPEYYEQVVLLNMRLVASGPTESVFTRANLQKAYGGRLDILDDAADALAARRTQPMIAYNTAVVLAGASLLGASTGLVGSFAVLRRRALLGDALAHAAFPGVCLAFLCLDRRNLPAMLFGALVTGIVGVSLLIGLRRATRVKEDAAIGVVLSVFFGAGLALSRMIQNRSSAGSRAGLDSYIFGSAATMRIAELWLIAGVAAACLAIVLLFYKEFKLVAFDMGFARVQGWPAGRLDLLLMGLIAVTVVIGLPAVGAVLIAAMLILPAAAARFWTDRLGVMLVVSAALGAASAAAGTLLSAQYDGLPTGPTIVLVGAAAFLCSALFAFRRGALSRSFRQLRFRRRLEEQRLLRTLYEAAEAGRQASPLASSHRVTHPPANAGRSPDWQRAARPVALRRAVRAGWLTVEPGGYGLSEQGLARAARVVRGYRLWRLFLSECADQVGAFGELDVEAVDERLPASVVSALESRLLAEGRLPAAEGERPRMRPS